MTKPPTKSGSVLIASNRRASFDYELGERWEAGLVLTGSEVKTLRNGSCNLTDGWVSLDRDGMYLKGVMVPPLNHAAFGHDERRPRKLLLHQKEIAKIERAITQGGLTVVPLKVYWKDGRAKVEIAIGRGKKKADKRAAVKERELDREARAAMTRTR